MMIYCWKWYNYDRIEYSVIKKNSVINKLSGFGWNFVWWFSIMEDFDDKGCWIWYEL